MNISHILVATDLSDEALGCIPDVAELARSVGARITLLHVLEAYAAIPQGTPLAPPLGPIITDADMAATRARLEERRGAFGNDVRTDVAVVSGDPGEAIAIWAAEHEVDLIAMTTHGRTGFRRLALGSVAESVLRRSRVPVLVLPLRRD